MPPATRARFAQSIQEEVCKLPAIQCAAIQKSCGSAWQDIATSQPVTWLDEATYNALTNSIRKHLGDPATIRLFRGLGRRIIQNPNLQSFVEGVFRMFGLSPHTLLKASPRGRETLVRDSGTLEYEYVGPNAANLHLRHFPVSTFKSGTTVVLLSGTFLGLLDASGCEKTAKLTTSRVELHAGHAIFHLSW